MYRIKTPKSNNIYRRGRDINIIDKTIKQLVIILEEVDLQTNIQQQINTLIDELEKTKLERK